MPNFRALGKELNANLRMGEICEDAVFYWIARETIMAKNPCAARCQLNEVLQIS